MDPNRGFQFVTKTHYRNPKNYFPRRRSLNNLIRVTPGLSITPECSTKHQSLTDLELLKSTTVLSTLLDRLFLFLLKLKVDISNIDPWVDPSIVNKKNKIMYLEQKLTQYTSNISAHMKLTLIEIERDLQRIDQVVLRDENMLDDEKMRVLQKDRIVLAHIWNCIKDITAEVRLLSRDLRRSIDKIDKGMYLSSEDVSNIQIRQAEAVKAISLLMKYKIQLDEITIFLMANAELF